MLFRFFFSFRNFLKAQVIDLESKVKDLDNRCFEFEVERAEMDKSVAVAVPEVVTLPVVVKPETNEGATMTELSMEQMALEKKPVTQIVQEIVKVNVPLPYGPHLSKSKQSVVFKKGGYTWMLLLVSIYFCYFNCFPYISNIFNVIISLCRWL